MKLNLIPSKIKSILLLIVFPCISIMFAFFAYKIVNNYKSLQVENDILINEEISIKESPFAKINEPIYGVPKKIIFESLDKKVDIMKVGVTDNGVLEDPVKWDLAGWYFRSARPSEEGNLIINAHYDDTKGQPAAFWQLKNINIDDKVSVIDSFGRFHDYRVKDKFYIEMNDPNRLDIVDIDSNERSEMTLITCGGVYQPAQGYNKRLVVKAELIQD